MKKILDWQSKAVVNIFDEVNLWSAPFGRLMLENIPMNQGATILDIGFGTGFPLVELSQRFGNGSTVYGIDIWKEAILRTQEKIRVLELKNITIIEESASKINLEDNLIDLITSNLGVNNFEEKEKVYAEIHRVLKPGGSLCITTNPIGTFKELFNLFGTVLEEMKLVDAQTQLKHYIDHRDTKESIVKTFKEFDLILTNSTSDQTNVRFTEAEALFNHSLIRAGFREFWEQMIPDDKHETFYKIIYQKIDDRIKFQGSFKITIPMLFLEFEKPSLKFNSTK